MTWLDKLSIHKISLVPRGANPGAYVVLFKSADPPAPPPADPIPPPADVGDIHKETTMKIDRTKLSKEEVEYLDDLEAKVAKIVPDPDPPPPVPDAIQKMLDEQKAEIAKANERAAAAEKAAQVEKEARERVEFAKTAETDIPHLTGTAQEKGNLLYDLAKSLAKDAYDKVLALLKSGDEAVKKSLLTPSGDDHPITGDAYGRLVTLAKEKVKAGQVSTEEQGFVKAVEENPDLANQYRSENRRASFAE